MWSISNPAMLGFGEGSNDPIWNGNSLLVKQQTPFYADVSSNNFQITRNGNVRGSLRTPSGGLGSAYFTGSGDRLSATYNTVFNWWAYSGYTIQAWIYCSSFSSFPSAGNAPNLIGNYDTNTIIWNWSFGPMNDGRISWNNNGATQRYSTATLNTNAWNHIAFTRTSSGIQLWVNGVGSSVFANTGNQISSTGTPLTIGQGWNSGSMLAYVSGLEIANVARYTSNFTPTTYTTDANTILLTCTTPYAPDNNTFLDGSSNDFTITRNGNVTQGTFGPASGVNSAYFDGNGDYLSVASNAAFSFGTGDFTIQSWFYAPTTISPGVDDTGDRFFVSASGSGGLFFGIKTRTTIQIGIGRAGVVWDNVVNATITGGTWNHIAVTRASGTVRFWFNGVQLGSSFTNTNSYNLSTTSLTVGSQGTSFYLTGNLSLVRVDNVALYASTFTPSTSYTAHPTQTVLFLPFSNAGIYDATRKNNIETVGGVSVSTGVTRFGLPSIFYGSTSGNYLSIPHSPNLNLGSSDFTIDFHLYPAANNKNLLSKSGNGSNIEYGVYIDGGNKIAFYFSTNGTSQTTLFSTTSINLNAWNFIQIVRSGSNVIFRINGIQDTPQSISGTLFAGTASLLIGKFIGNSNDFQGNDFDWRITKGYARPNVVPALPFPTF